MTECNYCGKKIEGVLPHKCKFCGQIHCHNHLLPESHDCVGLEEHKKRHIERWRDASIFSSVKEYEEPEEIIDKPRKNIHKSHSKRNYNKQYFNSKVKNYFLTKYEDLIYWLKKREHYKYDYSRRANYLITTILIFVASIVGFNIFYSNATKLNEINLWIIKLGGILILTSLFFAVKFGWRLGKEGINILKRQRNWLKYLIIILIIFLLWQAYTNKDTVLNPVFDTYNRTNFSLFAPVSFGNFSFEGDSSQSSTYSNTNKGNSGFGDFVQGVFDPKSQIDISELEQEVHRRINLERANNDLKPLSWDSKIYQIAKEHSEDMIIRNFYSHDNPDGEDPTDRADRHGYSCVKNYGSYYTYGLAENIAITPIYSDVIGCGSTTSLDSLAECIVDGWMTSPGHRENILTSTYTKTGIGIAYSDNDEAYSTQNFC